MESPLKILLPVATYWKTIGILLGLRMDILDKIQSEERYENNRLLVMLSQWPKQLTNSPPTWAALADAVEEINPFRAKLIREKHPDKHELFPEL